MVTSTNQSITHVTQAGRVLDLSYSEGSIAANAKQRQTGWPFPTRKTQRELGSHTSWECPLPKIQRVSKNLYTVWKLVRIFKELNSYESAINRKFSDIWAVRRAPRTRLNSCIFHSIVFHLNTCYNFFIKWSIDCFVLFWSLKHKNNYYLQQNAGYP